jgi:hypothetical protein
MNNFYKPIFVFGCCNSGTTILWQALKSHQNLCGPEVEGQDLETLPKVMKHYLGKSTFRLWAHPKFKSCYYLTEKDCSEENATIVKDVYKKYLIENKRFITKSPADTMRARFIQEVFPDAIFIAVVRNGYAVSEGIVRKRKLDPDRPQFEGLYTTIEEAAEQWFRANVVCLSHTKFLRNYKIIRYEDLVNNPKETLHSVLDFCELNKNDFQIPEFDKTKNEEQISRLGGYEIENITRIAFPMLTHFDYEIINPKLNWIDM